MGALARIGVLVKMRAVELCEPVSVTREMRGSPIENDSNAGLVCAIDEFHEFRGRAVAARRGVVAERLIAPGAVVGMLHDGQQLDMRVAHFPYVGNELISKFAIGEPTVFVFRNAAPRAEMDFVNGNWRIEPIFL